jgi:succinoglycan biosynthesis protein ExoA
MIHPVRILHLRSCNFLGGPERQLIRSTELEKDGPLEIVLATVVGEKEGREFAEAINNRGLKALVLPTGSLGNFRTFMALLRYLREREVALLCTHGYRDYVVGTLAARILGIPVAAFLRGWTRENWKVRFYESLHLALLPLATRVVCLSKVQADRVSRRRSLSHKTRVVVNAIETRTISEDERESARREICQRFNLPAGSALVAIAGRLSPEKGAIHFIQAVPAIRSQFPGTRFIVFGDGPLRAELENTARELSPTGEICLTGHVPDFPRLLPGIHVLVNPSLSEEMPNVVLEAMAAGVPVVATNVGGVAEICGEGGLVLIPPRDWMAIAQSVSAMLSDSSYRDTQGRAGQERVRKAFSLNQQRTQLNALYQELIDGLTHSDPATAGAQDTRREDGRATASANPRKQAPLISIVLPVRNEEAHLGAVLDALLAQDYPTERFEVLVVDGGSTDGTAALAKRYARAEAPRVILLSNSGRLSSAGRNVGIRASRGEIVCFIDGHCSIATPRLLLETARLFEETGADALSRPQPLNLEGNTLLQDVIAHARSTTLGHGSDSTIYAMDREGFVNPTSSGAVYLRSVFGRVGLYDERFDACEDVEFNYRLHQSGMRAYSSPAIAVYYRPRASLGGIFRQLVRYGRGRFRFVSKHSSAFSVSQLIPALFLAGLLVGGAFSFLSAPVRYLYGGILALYAAIVLFYSMALGSRFGWRHFFMAPIVYLTIHVALGVGFWAEAAQSFWGKLYSMGRRSSKPSGSRQEHSAPDCIVQEDFSQRGDSKAPATTVKM